MWLPPVAPNEGGVVGGSEKKDPFNKVYKDLPRDRDWHDYEAMKKDLGRSGPGEGGKAVVLPKDSDTKKTPRSGAFLSFTFGNIFPTFWTLVYLHIAIISKLNNSKKIE